MPCDGSAASTRSSVKWVVHAGPPDLAAVAGDQPVPTAGGWQVAGTTDGGEMTGSSARLLGAGASRAPVAAAASTLNGIPAGSARSAAVCRSGKRSRSQPSTWTTAVPGSDPPIGPEYSSGPD